MANGFQCKLILTYRLGIIYLYAVYYLGTYDIEGSIKYFDTTMSSILNIN